MTKELKKLQPDFFTADDPGWGTASDRRGLGRDDKGKSYAEYAIEFLKHFPIGTNPFSASVFDDWLQRQGLLTLPPIDAPKNSDAWLGHLQRRHQCRVKINNAAVHPRLAEMGSSPFIIAAVAGAFEVRAPHIEISKGEAARKIGTLAETKKRQLTYLMQSADWPILPPHERSIAETIYDDIDALVEDTKTGADRISRKLVKLQQSIKAQIKAGTIVPRNHGLQQLIESPDNDTDD